MLINNKNLIKTIKRVDLTTEQETNLNEISNIKNDLNNIKNTELENLNTAINTLETLVGIDETLGDKTGLPSGDANVIASINRIDAKNSSNFDYDNTISSLEYLNLNITPTLDTSGNKFNCHGLGIMYYNGVYYAYGESKTGETITGSGNAFIPTTGVNCYSSTNLINWKFENKVLKPDESNSESIIHTSKVIERPKVVYNKKNNNFVMFFHADTSRYDFAKIGIAICNTPTGDFELIGAYRPVDENSTCRDLTVFVDDDDKAYVFVSRDNNLSMYAYLLNDDYTGFTNTYSKVIDNGKRESPAVFKYNNKYYLLTSGLTGWAANPNAIYSSNEILGTYTQENLVSKNDTNNNTYGGQSTYVLKVPKDKYGYEYIAMFDIWNSSDLESSSYLWLPLYIENDGKFYIDKLNKQTVRYKKNTLNISINDSDNPYYQFTIFDAIKDLSNRITGGSSSSSNILPTEDYSVSDATFDGTSSTNTMQTLFDEDKNFTFFIKFTGSSSNVNQSNKHVLFHCMNESTPYPGIQCAIVAAGYYQFNIYDKTVLSTISYNDTNAHTIVITHEQGTSNFSLYVDGVLNTVTVNSFTTINSQLVLGGYFNGTSYGRYWNGTINSLKLYSEVLTSKQIQKLISQA